MLALNNIATNCWSLDFIKSENINAATGIEQEHKNGFNIFLNRFFGDIEKYFLIRIKDNIICSTIQKHRIHTNVQNHQLAPSI